MEIKDLLRINREKNKLTQEQLADQIYVSRQAVSKWERGESLPDLENVILLSDLYDISIDQLLRGANFLVKPFQIGEYNNKKNLVIGIMISLFFALIASGGKYVVAFFVVLMILLSITVTTVKEGKIIITKKDIRIIEYRNFAQKILSIIKPINSHISYTFEEIESFNIIYVKRTRVSPFDFNPDTFNVEFVTKSGQVYYRQSSPFVTKNLPILCDYLKKKGVTIMDTKDILGMIVRNENIYETIHAST